MSTRCQVIVKDEYDEVWFYRHSDGYPEGALPTLNKFMQMVQEGKIRNGAEQASGWLVLIGAQEYGVTLDSPSGGFMDWKCGSYEPCSPEEHGDIAYLYTLDLEKLTIKIKNVNNNTTGYVTELN